MTDIPELANLDQFSPEDLAEGIAELEQYRDRLVNDMATMAQRAKVTKTVANNQLEPELTKIDAMLQALRDRQSALSLAN
jgi:predicted component of type VI protein secretion system